jgi:pyruvate ferredoxin oxidoreductase alpha subunit
MDRAISTGSSGPLFPEVRTALYDSADRPDITNYVYGLGGRDVKIDELKGVYKQLMTKDHDMVNYLGVRP